MEFPSPPPHPSAALPPHSLPMSSLCSSRNLPTGSSAARRVRFGGTTVLGEEHAAAAGDKDDASSVHSNESEAPLAYNLQPSS
ncbi:unnamed protein product [Urochloa humidicola]